MRKIMQFLRRMQKAKSALFTLLVATFVVQPCIAQQRNFWTPVNESSVTKNLFTERVKPAAYKLFLLQDLPLKTELQNAPSERNISVKASTFIITVPAPDGSLEKYRIVEAPVMEPKLAAKYPGIRSYAGINIDDPSSTIRFDVSPLGFHAMILSSKRPTIYISPADRSQEYYIVASRNDMLDHTIGFECLTKDVSGMPVIKGGDNLRNADDAKLRTFRLALAASGEFSQFWLNGSEPDDAARRTKVLAAQNMLVTRCNGIFEKDFGLRLLLIGNNDAIIYLDAATDPWPGSGYNSQTQTTIDAEITNADYDIGHLVDRHGNNGNAGCIGCVCNSGSKGSGFTSLSGSNWNNDQFVIDYLPHEMGHQLGGNHTFSHASEGPTIAQVEPGSGTTIMGYAGITGAVTDVQAHSHDNFHAVSIQQITDYIKAAGCTNVSNTGNNTPSANAGGDYTIPKSTPFQLTGSGSDADGGDVLNFVWEEMDVATSFGAQPSSSATGGPQFRCFAPTAAPTRTFPTLANILDGSNGNTWERLPSVGRSLNFRFTVRDNHPSAGNNRSDDMVVTVFEEAGPFTVTSPNSAVTWCPGAHTVTWDVNGSDALAENVNILLSTDGGNTFPITLASATPNDGSQSVTIPCVQSNQARIKIEGAGNIFFDISNANFTTGDNTNPTFTRPANIIIYKDAFCSYDASLGVTGDVTDEADNCDNTLDATYADDVSAGSCEGETIITRTWTLTDDCSNSTQKIQTITIQDNTPPTFTAPANITIYKDAACNHNASVGATGDVTDEADNCDASLNATFTDVSVPGSCMGEVVITRTWSLTDDCLNTTTHNQVITVRDTTRPVFSGVSPNPPNLWPPNHTMRDVTINYVVTDNCSDAAHITSTLAVSSNEPVNGTGDGNTSPDWIIVDNHHLKLRAERAGNKTGRIYTITITSRDDCGNVAVTQTTVIVEHDMSRSYVAVAEETPGFIVTATPNPSSGSFNINVSSDNRSEKIMLTVLDMNGRKIEEHGIITGITRIGNNYIPGMYTIRVMQGMRLKEMKLLKTGK